MAGFVSGEGRGIGEGASSACWTGSLSGRGWKEKGVGWTGLRKGWGRGLVPAENALGATVGEVGDENRWACLAGWCTWGKGSSTRVNGVGEGRRG